MLLFLKKEKILWQLKSGSYRVEVYCPKNLERILD